MRSFAPRPLEAGAAVLDFAAGLRGLLAGAGTGPRAGGGLRVVMVGLMWSKV
jgi:hypothetical protein